MVKSYEFKWVGYVIFGLCLFLVFCLIFESYIELPRVVAWVGRWHPLVLHFPIVLLLICAFLGLTGRKIPRQLLIFSVVFALLTAISGFFLGKESGTKGDLLIWHQWLGAGLALLAAGWYWLESIRFSQSIFSKMLSVAIIALVFFTGHYGGMVTHGEEFLALPLEKRKEEIPENPLVYKDIVSRILDAKCVSCHNPNKKKGDFLMTSLEGLLSGGELGNTIIAGNALESELIKRVHLPFEDEGHMPPDGKKPLDGNEIQIIERWISLGASDTLRLDHLEPSEPLTGLIKDMMQPDPSEKWKNMPKVADSSLQRLSSDYLTVRRLSNGANALSINLYTSPKYQAAQLLGLGPIAENIVQMDVSGIPIGQEELNIIASFENLEWLEIDQTPITDTEMDTLKGLSDLRILKIYSTEITDKSLPVLKKMQNLKKVYVWNTKISNEALLELKNENPALHIDSGVSAELQSFFSRADSLEVK